MPQDHPERLSRGLPFASGRQMLQWSSTTLVSIIRTVSSQMFRVVTGPNTEEGRDDNR
jgi:hypothetical protein